MKATVVAVSALAACLIALAVETWPKPRDRSPSRLEKSCLYAGNAVPCFIRDEALQQTWDI